MRNNLKLQPLATLSMISGLILFILSFMVHGFIYGELFMALAIMLTLSGMHHQTRAVNNVEENEESPLIFNQQAVTKITETSPTAGYRTKKETSSLVNP